MIGLSVLGTPFTFFEEEVEEEISASFHSEKQKFAPSNLVTLFQIDLGELGGDLLRFCSSTDEGQPILWDGNLYYPVPVEATGFEISSGGTLPTPTLRVLNVPSLQAGVIALNDLLGGIVYRIRTFKTFLDNGDTPDPTAHFPIDIFKIDRKVTQNKVFIEWELAASIDQENRQIPGRQVIRDYCPRIYRRYDPLTGEFDYSKATCPYEGSASYNENDDVVAASEDRCGKRLSSCRARFGNNAELPTWAFPGVARVK